MQRRAKAWIFAALVTWGIEATCFAAPKTSAVDRLVQEGRWLEARETLARDAKKGSSASRKRARARLDALTKKMPRLVVRMPRDVEARVTVDGWPVAPADETTLRVDPGQHVIEVDGRRENIDLEAGSKHVFVVEAQKPTAPTSNISVPSAAPAARSTDMSTGSAGTLVSSTSTFTPKSTGPAGAQVTSNPMRTAAWIGLGVGGAAIAGGAIFAATAAHERDVLSVRCPNDRCAERDREAWEEGKAHANLATVMLGAGAAVTATSIAILVFAPTSQEKVALRASASQISIAGTFQ